MTQAKREAWGPGGPGPGSDGAVEQLTVCCTALCRAASHELGGPGPLKAVPRSQTLGRFQAPPGLAPHHLILSCGREGARICPRGHSKLARAWLLSQSWGRPGVAGGGGQGSWLTYRKAVQFSQESHFLNIWWPLGPDRPADLQLQMLRFSISAARESLLGGFRQSQGPGLISEQPKISGVGPKSPTLQKPPHSSVREGWKGKALVEEENNHRPTPLEEGGWPRHLTLCLPLGRVSLPSVTTYKSHRRKAPLLHIASSELNVKCR